MTDTRDILEGVRAHLIGAGMVRDPDTPGDLAAMWLAPSEGLNAPNEGTKPSYRSAIVIGAELAPGIPSRAREAFIVNTAIDFTIRAMKAPPAYAIGDRLRRELADRTAWTLPNGVLISQVQEIVPLQPLNQDQQGWRFRTQYVFTWQDLELAADRGWGRMTDESGDDAPDEGASEYDESVTVQRRHLHEAAQALPELDPNLPDGAYLANWVFVADYVDPDGSRWFVSRRGTDGGERDLMPWTEKGLITHLHDQWNSRDLARELRDDDNF